MSALDERIRHLAREVLSGLADGLPAASGDDDRVTTLEQRLTALTARVDELEKASAPAAPVKRAARKTTPESE